MKENVYEMKKDVYEFYEELKRYEHKKKGFSYILKGARNIAYRKDSEIMLRAFEYYYVADDGKVDTDYLPSELSLNIHEVWIMVHRKLAEYFSSLKKQREKIIEQGFEVSKIEHQDFYDEIMMKLEENIKSSKKES